MNNQVKGVKGFKFFGIHIERKTDILAFAAFVISIGSLIAQFINLIRGPDIVLNGPRIVTIYSSDGGDGEKYVRLLAKFHYLNNGSPGYDDFLKSERAVILVDNNRIELEAKNYVDTHSDGKKMHRGRSGDADPVSLKSGAIQSHETEFIPFQSENFILIKDFISILENSSNLEVRFHAETFGGQKLSKSCELKPKTVLNYLTDNDKYINDEQVGWSANTCN